MDFVLKPSLEHMALVKITVTLWNQDDIKALVNGFNFHEHYKESKKIQDKVNEQVPKLLLPEPLKKKVLNFIPVIGLEILRWRDYHDRYSRLSIGLPNHLYWTPQGTVDRKKTAEMLIRDKNLDIDTRFKLACIYCLENDILELFEKLPKTLKKIPLYTADPRKYDGNKLVVLWKEYLYPQEKMVGIERHQRRLHFSITDRIACKCAAIDGNKSAAEYIFQKLNSLDKEECLDTLARTITGLAYCVYPKEYNSDILCFLLTQMNEDKLIEVINKSKQYGILRFFLYWPWQCFFMKIVNRVWNFFSEVEYASLLFNISEVRLGYKELNYHKFFEELWHRGSSDQKHFLINQTSVIEQLITNLFEVEDQESINLVIKDPTWVRKDYISSCTEYCIYKRLFDEKKWNLLEFFCVECISKERLNQFQAKTKKFAIGQYNMQKS